MVSVQAVVLDVGGVLLLPDPQLLGAALTAEGIPHDEPALLLAHFGGVRHVDAAPAAGDSGDAPAVYLAGLATAAGVPADHLEAAATALRPLFTGPSIELWRRPTPWAEAGLRALETTGLPVAVVSNSDGTVEQALRRYGLAQVGPGTGLEVAAVVDSAVVGVAKPDPGIFAPAIEALDLPAQRCRYIGDTVTYDVIGARAAGLRPVHLALDDGCGHEDHPHATDLASAVDDLAP